MCHYLKFDSDANVRVHTTAVLDLVKIFFAGGDKKSPPAKPMLSIKKVVILFDINTIKCKIGITFIVFVILNSSLSGRRNEE